MGFKSWINRKSDQVQNWLDDHNIGGEAGVTYQGNTGAPPAGYYEQPNPSQEPVAPAYDINTPVVLQPPHGLGDGTAGNVGAGAGYTYDTNIYLPSLLGNDTGLMADPSLYPEFRSDFSSPVMYSGYTPPNYLNEGNSSLATELSFNPNIDYNKDKGFDVDISPYYNPQQKEMEWSNTSPWKMIGAPSYSSADWKAKGTLPSYDEIIAGMTGEVSTPEQTPESQPVVDWTKEAKKKDRWLSFGAKKDGWLNWENYA